jgi:hypothetical protein
VGAISTVVERHQKKGLAIAMSRDSYLLSDRSTNYFSLRHVNFGFLETTTSYSLRMESANFIPLGNASAKGPSGLPEKREGKTKGICQLFVPIEQSSNNCASNGGTMPLLQMLPRERDY